MADIGAATWSQTDATNNSASPAGFPEGMAPSGVNDSARAVMGAIRRWHDHVGPTVTSAGTADVQTLTYAIALSAYVIGEEFVFLAGFTNTGPATLDINALGPISVVTNDLQALTGQEIQAGQIISVYYDGTYFRLGNINRQLNAASGYVKLLGGLTMQWGQVNFGAGGSSQAVTFPIAFAATLNVQLTMIGAVLTTTFASVGSPTTTGFDCNLNQQAPTSLAVYYVALGI